MNELARLIDELEDCCVCGKPCGPEDDLDTGEWCHPDCYAQLAEKRYDDWCNRQPEGIS